MQDTTQATDAPQAAVYDATPAFRALASRVRDSMQALKALYIEEVLAFCAEHGVEDALVSQVKVAYRDHADTSIHLSCEVRLPGVAEKEQIKPLRAIEEAWNASSRTDWRNPRKVVVPGYRDATFHPTSKYYSRRLHLEHRRSPDDD